MISIISPLYNSGSFIGETIESVLSQSFSDWELIVVDDCSTDHGPAIVKSYQRSDSRIKLITNTVNMGPAISRNRGIEYASGRFIAFLDTDDLWYPNKLEMQVRFMLDNKCAFSFTAYDKISETGEVVGEIHVPSEVTYHSLLRTCSVGCLTAMYDTAQIGKVYMPIIDKRQDFALWLKICKMIQKGYGLDIKLAKYRLRKNSISGNKLKAAKYQWKVYREIERLNIFLSVYYFFSYTWNGFVKTYFK